MAVDRMTIDVDGTPDPTYALEVGGAVSFSDGQFIFDAHGSMAARKFVVDIDDPRFYLDLDDPDDIDLDEQTYEEDIDDFVPTREIPADTPIAFPSNI